MHTTGEQVGVVTAQDGPLGTNGPSDTKPTKERAKDAPTFVTSAPRRGESVSTVHVTLLFGHALEHGFEPHPPVKALNCLARFLHSTPARTRGVPSKCKAKVFGQSNADEHNK
eukprot:5610472-Amphidinium_carterae.1